MEECIPQCRASKLLVVGIVLILARIYTTWDIWIVIGALLVIKALMLFAMPVCACQKRNKKR